MICELFAATDEIYFLEIYWLITYEYVEYNKAR